MSEDMSFYFVQNNKISKLISGILLVLFLLQPISALATVYQPGETLNPACAPTDADCGVAAPITASSTSALSLGGAPPEGSLFYVAGTSTLQNIIPAGNLQYSIGSPESRLQNVYTNNLILGSASFVMEDVGGVLRFRDVNSVIPGLVIDPSSGATINGNIFINGGATFANATTTGSHSIGGALVLGGESFQNFVGAGLKVASSTLALDNSGDWAGTFEGQEASYFFANSFSTSSANSWLGGKTTNNLTEGSNLYWTTSRGDENFTSNLSATTTDALVEGADNKYYTDTRARNALSVSAPLSYSTSTGFFSLAIGNITAPSNPEITIGGGTGAVVGSGVTITVPEADAITRGFVSTTTQVFAGSKIFSSAPTFSTINSGSILFAGTGGLVSQDNSNLFWDNANSRLGIGLLNPTDTLNVYGGIKTEGAVGAIMAAGSDGAFVYNFGSGVSNSLSKRVSQSSDDAEQNLATGSVNLTSSDLELINDNGVDQEVGIRFQNITIPQGATITNAYIEFIVDGAFSGTTNLNFYGEAADNAAVFAATTNNITGRTKTSTTVAWSNVPAWTVSGQTQQTPNLTSIIQEIINRAGWLSGNSLAVIVNGTAGSLRRAVSYNGNAASAALLVVQYTTNSTNVSYAINNLGPGLFRINDEFNDASPFVVDSSGNVGVGTASPSQKFHVSGGNIKLDWGKAIVWRNAVDSADTEVIRVTGINPNQNSLNLTIPGGPTADPSNARFVISADGSFYFRNNTPTDIMRLTSAGSLGVGTASPGAKFHIIGDNNTAGFLFNTSDIGAVAVPFKIAGTDVGAASTVLSSTVLTNNTTGGNQNAMLIENAAGLGVTDALLKLNNADTDTAVSDGLLITSANGFITDAIDISGTNITNAINIGGNIITGDSLSIDGDGNVGIGTTTPAQLLHIARSTDGVVARFTDVNGDCDINPTNIALICASDISLKKNILTLDNSLEKVLALNPITFNWNGEKDGAATHLGFIAQEVEVLFPELVFTDVESGVKSIAYGNFAPILAKAIQEIAALGETFKQKLITWFADAANGIADFFVKKIHTEQICLKKSDGSEYCVNGDDLEAIMQGRGEIIVEFPSSIHGEVIKADNDNADIVQTEKAPAIIENPETLPSVEVQLKEPISIPETVLPEIDNSELAPNQSLQNSDTPVQEINE